MSKHNATKYIRTADNQEVSADEATSSKTGLLRSGFSMRTPMFAMDSAQKSGFHIDDDGRVFLNGHPYKVPLELCDDGVARPTLDRKKILGPNGEIEPDETEREESDAASALLSDGTTVASHRPGFYRGPRDYAAEDRLDAVRVTCDYLDCERWKNGNSNPAAAPIRHTDAQSGEDAREQAYLAYDAEMEAAHRKAR